MGVAHDYAEALKLYRLEAVPGFGHALPAEHPGIAEAQYKLGLMHADGRGVTQDFAEAREWIQLAAAQGHAEAQDLLT